MRELQHHGILGQKWGVRRYQNPDGTLTPAGKKRYGGYGLDKAETPDQFIGGVYNAAQRIKKDRNLKGEYTTFVNTREAVMEELTDNEKVKEIGRKVKDLYKQVRELEEKLYANEDPTFEPTYEQYMQFDALDRKLRNTTSKYVEKLLGGLKNNPWNDTSNLYLMSTVNGLVTQASWRNAFMFGQ